VDHWAQFGTTWSHALDLSNAADGRTVMQFDLAPLAGQKVVSAQLSFKILDGQDAPSTAQVRISGFDNGNGDLALTWDAPTGGLGSVQHSIFNGSTASQAFDITALVGQGVAQGTGWMGLHLQNLGLESLATRTYEFLENEHRAVIDLDRAQVRVDVITAAVPEPDTWALMAAGGVALGWLRRRRAAQAVG
jgi:hypothetical protein